jgi:outer membrane protein TolC
VKPLPVGLDSVFRLAEEQNPRIAQAREKVQESCLEAELKAREARLPRVTAGLTYFRHEGGIQDQDGTLINSSTGALFPGVGISAGVNLREAAFTRLNGVRKGAESRAELVKINNEILLEAATTYVDLLAARKGETVAREAERMQAEMMQRAEKLAAEEPLARVVVEAARAEVIASRQMAVHLQQQGNAAAAKLAYLLGLGCDIEPTPIDPDIVPIQLFDISSPVEALVSQVQQSGPGVQELHELLGVIQTGLDESEGYKQYLPTVQLTALEGPFMAGPGGTLGMSNRLDVALGVKWDLTEFLTAQEKRRIARSKMAQVEYTTRELKNKLALAVKEARDLILASRERFGMATTQIGALA